MSPTTSKMSLSRMLDNAMMVLGFWLLISPGFLGLSSSSPDNWVAACSGAVLIALIIASRLVFRVWEEWLAVLFGAFLTILPWIVVLSGGPKSTINFVACGIAAMVLAGWRIFDTTHHHGPMTA